MQMDKNPMRIAEITDAVPGPSERSTRHRLAASTLAPASPGQPKSQSSLRPKPSRARPENGNSSPSISRPSDSQRRRKGYRPARRESGVQSLHGPFPPVAGTAANNG